MGDENKDDNKQPVAEEAPTSPKNESTLVPAITVVVTPGNDGKPTTKGEELFFVHLNRLKNKEPTEDDFDHEAPRKRSRSVGEELWEVYLKRSKGVPPDYDTDEPANHPAAIARRRKNTTTTSHRKSSTKMPERCSERIAKIMHLRNRDVKKAIL